MELIGTQAAVVHQAVAQTELVDQAAVVLQRQGQQILAVVEVLLKIQQTATQAAPEL